MEKAIYSKDGKRVINLKSRETFKTENVQFEWELDDPKPPQHKKKKKKKSKGKGQQVVIDSINLDEQSIVHGVIEAKMRAEKLEKLKNTINNTFPPSPSSGLSPSMERETIKYFWLSLTPEQRQELIQVEKDAVLAKMKRQQKNTCECEICGRKRIAIEQELETLYADYYRELDALAETKSLPLLPLPSMGFFRADHVLRGGHQGGDEDVDDGNVDDSELIKQLTLQPTTRPIPSNLGKEIYTQEEGDTEEDEPFESTAAREVVQGLDVSSVADDLLTNDGKKFIEMMERLAEKRAERIEEVVDEEEVNEDELVEDPEQYENDSDYSDYSSDYSQTGESLTADQRMEEGRRMFQIFAARMFEQRVLHAYKLSVAAQVKAELQQMEEEKRALELEKEARDQQRRERKKEKKRAAKALKEEERKKALAEKLEREKREAEEAEKLRLEEERKQKEREKEKEARKAAAEAKKKLRQEEQARLAREKEEKRLARIREMEERIRQAKLDEEREREERLDKERKERERLENERLEQEKREEERKEKEKLEKEKLEKEKLEKEKLEKEKLEAEQKEKERLEVEQRGKEEKDRMEQARKSLPHPILAHQPGTSLGGLQQPIPQVLEPSQLPPGFQAPGFQLRGLPDPLGEPVMRSPPQPLAQPITSSQPAQSQILLNQLQGGHIVSLPTPPSGADRLTPDPNPRSSSERHSPSPGSSTSNAKTLLDSLLRPSQPIVVPTSSVPAIGAIGSIGGATSSVSVPISPPTSTLPLSNSHISTSHRFDPWTSSYSGIATSATPNSGLAPGTIPGKRIWATSGEVPGNVIRQAALDAYEELHRNGAIDCNGFVNSRALQNAAQKYSSTDQAFGVSELVRACQGSFDIVGGLMKPRGGI